MVALVGLLAAVAGIPGMVVAADALVQDTVAGIPLAPAGTVNSAPTRAAGPGPAVDANWGVDQPVQEIVAGAPSALSVTIYRAPARAEGAIDLDALAGFALISETRTVHLPPGESRLRFEGVADGIVAVSAIVAGLPGQVLEKNRDARLLSPSALQRAAIGRSLMLVRSNGRTGVTERVPVTLESASEQGVVFKTPEGVEALRCSGLPETFTYDDAVGLSASPTLSVRVRTQMPVTATVTLSYLAMGFDWAAQYVATLSADSTTLDLGAWVTLANGNGTGFPAARTQVVAGRLNRETEEVEPIGRPEPLVAQCWPQGTTSDPADLIGIARAQALGAPQWLVSAPSPKMASMAPRLEEAVVTAQQVTQEQLGDLKLYRIPERTAVASRQSKQVRLLDRSAIPVSAIYTADVSAEVAAEPLPAHRRLRTRNTVKNHLGLALPSGRVAIFARHGQDRLLLNESDIRDLAVDEEAEFDLGESPDVRVSATVDTKSSARARTNRESDHQVRLEISNAGAVPIEFELRLQLEAGARIVEADRPMEMKNGRPLFRLTVPAGTTASVHCRMRVSG